MTKNNKLIAIFKGQSIRRVWDEKANKWWFSVVDVVAALTNQLDHKKAKSHWTTLKNRLKTEESQVVTNCDHLTMTAKDGKMRETDAADTQTLLRIIQSIPSPKAEPFKLWLARVGYERLEEMSDPEKALNRSRDYWQRMGRSKKWIEQRMMGQAVRNKLTDYWQGHQVKKPKEYAILTDIIHKEWTDLTVADHKKLKSLQRQNLRDHMTDAELVFTALAELSTNQIAETMKVVGLKKNKLPAKRGGRVAKNARLELENRTGKKVVSGKNFLGKGKGIGLLK